MITLGRTTPDNPDFLMLVEELDKELWVRYPVIQEKFAPHNKVDGTGRIVLAYSDGKTVGCGCFRPMDEEGTIEIKRMYVLPALRGRGIAGLILNELETWGKKEGFTESKLETGRNQPEAISIYERNHYKVIPNYPPYANMAESVCMAKALS